MLLVGFVTYSFYVYASFQHFCEAFLFSAVNHKLAIHLHVILQPLFEMHLHGLVDFRYNENQCNTGDTSNCVFLVFDLITHSLSL